jgi:hypothetical protein
VGNTGEKGRIISNGWIWGWNGPSNVLFREDPALISFLGYMQTVNAIIRIEFTFPCLERI